MGIVLNHRLRDLVDRRACKQTRVSVGLESTEQEILLVGIKIEAV